MDNDFSPNNDFSPDKGGNRGAVDNGSSPYQGEGRRGLRLLLKVLLDVRVAGGVL